MRSVISEILSFTRGTSKNLHFSAYLYLKSLMFIFFIYEWTKIYYTHKHWENNEIKFIINLQSSTNSWYQKLWSSMTYSSNSKNTEKCNI